MPGPTPPYVESEVPSAMPMPPVAWIVKLAHEHIAVPTLNAHQRSYFHHNILSPFDKSEALNEATRKKVLADALAGAPFQHQSTSPVQDAAEEAAVAAEVAASGTPKGGPKAVGTDRDAVRATVRGFTRQGWEYALNKIIGNLWNAKKNKVLKTQAASSSAASTSASNANLTTANAMNILDLVEYTARAKFDNENRDAITALAKTYEGGNAGANTNKAEKALWMNADHQKWQVALEEELAMVSDAQRMAVLATGISNALGKLQATGRFPDFVATIEFGYFDGKQMCFEVVSAENIPTNVSIKTGFRSQHEEQSQSYLSSIHDWANSGLKELHASKLDKTKAALASQASRNPVFEPTSSDVDEMSSKEITSAMAEFFKLSFEHAHGTRDIPWVEIKSEPTRFFDISSLSLSFTLDDPSNLSRVERFELAAALIRVAGPGSPNFFMTANSDSAAGEQAAQAERDKAAEAERLRLELEAVATVAEADRLRREREDHAKAAEERLRLQAEEEREKVAEAERLRVQLEAEAAAETERQRKKAKEDEEAAEEERLHKQGEKSKPKGKKGKKPVEDASVPKPPPRPKVKPPKDAAVATRKSSRTTKAPKRLGEESDAEDAPPAKRPRL
ncbi:hypothetical protein C8F01DRAFT_1329428 [Mycena amicta]|nr:hypothetical protein C8F01DRAFT_1329428 [Mycena amicta]